MAADITLTRRRRMLAFLVEKGGSASIADANAFSELKLLAAHQAFSALMEGLVDGGFATWDGATFTITEAGRGEAELAPRGRGKRAAAEPVAAATEAPVAESVVTAAASTPAEPAAHDHGHGHDHGGGHDEDRPAAHDHGHGHDHGGGHDHDHHAAHDHGHDHDHGGGHGHDHGHTAPRPSSPRPPPRPTTPPPKKGLRRRLGDLVLRFLRAAKRR